MSSSYVFLLDSELDGKFYLAHDVKQHSCAIFTNVFLLRDPNTVIFYYCLFLSALNVFLLTGQYYIYSFYRQFTYSGDSKRLTIYHYCLAVQNGAVCYKN